MSSDRPRRPSADRIDWDSDKDGHQSSRMDRSRSERKTPKAKPTGLQEDAGSGSSSSAHDRAPAPPSRLQANTLIEPDDRGATRKRRAAAVSASEWERDWSGYGSEEVFRPPDHPAAKKRRTEDVGFIDEGSTTETAEEIEEKSSTRGSKGASTILKVTKMINNNRGQEESSEEEVGNKSNTSKKKKGVRYKDKFNFSLQCEFQAKFEKSFRIENNLYKCQEEGCRFECIREARVRAENHVQWHTKVRRPRRKKRGETFICCGIKFFLKEFHSHVREEHPEEVVHNPFKCCICEKPFSSKRLLRQHLNDHNLEYTCNLCNKSFSRKAGLEYHEINVHSDDHTKSGSGGKESFKIDGCKNFSENVNALNAAEKIGGVVGREAFQQAVELYPAEESLWQRYAALSSTRGQACSVLLQALDFAPQSVSLRVSYLRLLVDAAETSQDSESAWVEVEAQFLKAVTSVGHQHNSRDLWDIVTKYSKNIQSLRSEVEPEDLGYFVMESGSVMWSAVIASMKSQDAPAWKLEEMYQRWRLVEWQSTEFWYQYLQWLKTQGSGSVDKVHMAYDEMSAAFPNNFLVYREWSAFLEGLGRVEQARQVLLLVQPPTPASLTRLGVLELRQDRVEDAHQRLDQAMKLATKHSVPSISNAAIRLSRSLVKEGEITRACDVINSALSKDKGNSGLYRELVNVSMLLKDVSLTISVCNRAIKCVGNVHKDFFKDEMVLQAEINCVKEEKIIMLGKCEAPSKFFVCDECSYICSSKWNLNVHKRVHRKILSTICKKCLVDKNDIASLLEHSSKCRTYICQCGYNSKTAAQMKLHKVLHL